MKPYPSVYAKYEPRACARCRQSHVCTLTLQCPCFEVAISAKEMDYISFHYDDCLCEHCLQAMKLKIQQHALSTVPPPTTPIAQP